MKTQSNLYRETYNDYSRPRVIRGMIRSIERDGGSFSLTVVDGEGNRYNGVKILNHTGGCQSVFSGVPVQVNQEVYLLTTVPNEPVYVLGSIYHPSFEKIHQFIPYVPIEEELNAFSKQDYFVSNNGSSINISSANGLIFQSESNIRLGLGEDSKLRISKDGKAGELLLGGTQFLVERKRYIDEIDAKIVKMEELLNTLTTMITTIHGVYITAASNNPATPATAGILGGYYSGVATDLADANTQLGELLALPKRTPDEHTTDCAKAINYDILIPKNENE